MPIFNFVLTFLNVDCWDKIISYFASQYFTSCLVIKEIEEKYKGKKRKRKD